MNEWTRHIFLMLILTPLVQMLWSMWWLILCINLTSPLPDPALTHFYTMSNMALTAPTSHLWPSASPAERERLPRQCLGGWPGADASHSVLGPMCIPEPYYGHSREPLWPVLDHVPQCRKICIFGWGSGQAHQSHLKHAKGSIGRKILLSEGEKRGALHYHL